jgi:hypothetical protein
MIYVTIQRLCVYRFHIKHVAQAEILLEHMSNTNGSMMVENYECVLRKLEKLLTLKYLYQYRVRL